MTLEQLYTKIDDELELLVQEKSEYFEEFKKHKQKELKKSYAFLLWFLEFYGRQELNSLVKTYITDGHDDRSCDLIFSRADGKGVERYYVVQSKWVSKASRLIDKKEFGATLTEFSAILRGTREPGKNEAFNAQHQKLREHLIQNGEVQFIYFTLAQHNEEVDALQDSFNREWAPNVKLEVIQSDRLRRDFIEFRYKKVMVNNPLEYNYTPEEDKITLPIIRAEEDVTPSQKDLLYYSGRTDAYVVLVRPSTLFKLFNTYKFSLFFSNVRNPLHESNYNARIVETLLNQPDAFWYYNNGITGITQLMPKIGIKQYFWG